MRVPFSTLTLLCTFALGLLITRESSAKFQVGFAEKDITPAIGMEQAGGYSKAFHTSFHDPCKVRVGLFDDGKDPVVFVGVDALFVPRDLVLKAREGIKKQIKIDPNRIMIAASHSHSSGPVGIVQPKQYDFANDLVKKLAYEDSSVADSGYLLTMEKAIVDAVVTAHKTKRPAKVGVGRGEEKEVAFNRRLRMKNGEAWSHPGIGNPDIIDYAGPIDPEVGVLAAWDANDELLGIMVNYSCHCTTNPGGISANWVQYLEQVLQGGLQTRATVVFLQGACGDITQVDNKAKHRQLSGEAMSKFVGGRVGAEALKVILGMPKSDEMPLGAEQKVWNIKRRAPSEANVAKALSIVKDGTQASSTQKVFAKETVMLDALVKHEPEMEVEVQALQVGPAVFISNPAEYFVENGLKIKKGSAFPFTFVVELANGISGYVPTEEAFAKDGGGYETRLTTYSNLEITAGSQMRDIGIELSKKLSPGLVPQHPPVAPFKAPWEYGNLPPQLD